MFPFRELGTLFERVRSSELYRIFIRPPTQPPSVEATFHNQAREEGRHACVLGWFCILALILLATPTDFFFEAETLGLILRAKLFIVLVALFYIVALNVLGWFKRHPFRVSWVGVLLISVVSIHFVSRVGGPETFSLMWFLWPPFLSALCFRWELMERVAWTAAEAGVVWGAYFGPNPRYLEYRYLGAALELSVVCVLIAVLLGHFIHNLYRTSYYRGRELEQERKQLAREHQRSEELLLNILPEGVADQLKDQPETIADGYTETTVLFADLVGFTPMAEKLPPDAVVRMLDEVFTAFDRRLMNYEVEKIKTIGDRYFAVAGLPEPREDHAEQAALLAVDLLDAMDQFARGRETPFEVRVGLHTGSLVAGVIGEEKFSYDVWGDTVNIASRMEEEGVAGEIHVTPTTKFTLEMSSAHDFTFRQRGELSLKGKGTIETFFLEGVERPDDPED